MSAGKVKKGASRKTSFRRVKKGKKRGASSGGGGNAKKANSKGSAAGTKKKIVRKPMPKLNLGNKKVLPIKSDGGVVKKNVSFNDQLNTSTTFVKNSIVAEKSDQNSLVVDDISPNSTFEQQSSTIKAKNFNPAHQISAEKLAALSRKDRRSFLKKLKAKKKPNYELSCKVKLLWEKLRSKKVTLEEKNNLTDQLYGLVEGKCKELIFAHDTVRVLQCLMALKNAQIRTKLFEELKNDIVELSKMKYSKFFVIKMLKYGTPAQRNHVFTSLCGKFVDLMKHNVACDVVEYLYNEYAQALQRSQICSEFYCSEFQLFKIEEALNLQQILAKFPEKKSLIQKSAAETILSLVSKPAIQHSLLHRVCAEYLENFGQTDENSRAEIVDGLKDRIPQILHTKDGAFCSMYCVWFGSVKDRKSIVKSFKGLVQKVCSEQYGHQVLFAIFDSVDDTVTVAKIILQEIKTNLAEIVKNPHGIRVILYLLHARDPKHFFKQQIQLLSLGDANTVSKKPMDVKRRELLTEISPNLIDYAAENAREMIYESECKFPLLLEYIAEYCLGDKTTLYDSLKEMLSEEFVPCNVENMHIVEHSRGHYILKRLLINDKKLFINNESTFSEFLIDNLTAQQFSSWLCCNKGAFVVVQMMESGIKRVEEFLLENVVKKNTNKLKKYSFKGAEVLLKKLQTA